MDVSAAYRRASDGWPELFTSVRFLIFMGRGSLVSSTSGYCRAVRIARARELLEGGDTSQKQIAQSLGYKDVASFARVFRKAVGSAPGAYRKRFGRNGISPADFAAKDGSRQKKHIVEAGLQTG